MSSTSTYPATIDDISPAGKTDATTMAGDHPNHHNLLADAIEKIERELGVDPSGSYADVAARFAALGSGAASAVILAPDSGSRNQIVPTGNFTPLVIKAAAGQTQPLTQWLKEDGSTAFSMLPGGRLTLPGLFQFGDYQGTGFPNIICYAAPFILSMPSSPVALRLDDDGLLTVPLLKVNSNVSVSGNLDADAGGAQAALRFGAAADCKIRRESAGLLRLYQTGLQVDAGVKLNWGQSTQFWFHENGAIYFGSSNDVWLSRPGANALQVDGSLTVNRNFADDNLGPLFLNFNGTVQQVRRLAADSGGAGFRALVVPNSGA